MDALVLATLLCNTTGIAVITVGMALAYCLPNRRRPRQWAAVEAEPALHAPIAPQPAAARREEAELAHAA